MQDTAPHSGTGLDKSIFRKRVAIIVSKASFITDPSCTRTSKVPSCCLWKNLSCWLQKLSSPQPV